MNSASVVRWQLLHSASTSVMYSESSSAVPWKQGASWAVRSGMRGMALGIVSGTVGHMSLACRYGGTRLLSGNFSRRMVLRGGVELRTIKTPRESYECMGAWRANQRAPRGGLQLKRFYKGRRVHGVRPRGAMVGSDEGAGRVRAMTGVVGRCRNTGGRVRTGEPKQNERRGTYC